MNFDQSSYAPGDTVNIGVGVLNDGGRTICDADVSIEVNGPDSKIESLDIEISRECGPRSVTDKPDYSATYRPNQAGSYKVTVNAETANGRRTMTRSFEVINDVPFVVSRSGSMRIYPIEDYQMEITIAANQDFSGMIREPVPADFEISDISRNGQVTAKTAITWPDVSLKAGQSLTLTYTYDSPDISPQFYLLGPLELVLPLQDPAVAEEIKAWIEPRAWQIAVDAAFGDAADGVWDDGATWGNTSPGVVGTDFPGASDAVTINSHTVTMYGRESADDVTLATGGTLASDDDIFDNGLVGYWKLDTGSGTSAIDSSTNSNTGTLTNMEAGDWNTDTGTTDFSNFYSLNFDGVDEYVTMGDIDALDGISAITWSIWVKPNTAGTLDDIAGKWSSSGNNGLTFHTSDGYGADDILWGGWSGASFLQTTGNILPNDTWTHVVGLFDGTQSGNANRLKLYANGTEATVAFTGTVPTSTPDTAYDVRIGTDSEDGRAFPGLIDDIRIYTRALSTDEIKALAFGNGGEDMVLDVAGTWTNSGGTFTEDTGAVMFTSTSDEVITSNSDDFNDVIINDGLIGYWKLDETAAGSCSGELNDACDSSGYGNDGAWNGDATASAAVASLNFTNDRSVTLDGTGDYVETANTTSLDLTGAVTVSAWINTSTQNNERIAESRDSGSPFHGYTFYTDTSGFIVFQITASPDETTAFAQGTVDVVDGTWQHVAGTWDGTTITNYNNGVVDDTGSQTGTISKDVATRIGESTLSTGNEFTGKIDDVRIYDRALTSVEISALAVGNQPATENTAASEFLLEDTLDVNGDLILQTGELDVKASEDNAITVAGAWENNGGIYSPDGNTTTFDGSSGSHELQSGGQAFNNLTLATAGGTWTLNDDLDVDGTYTQSNATLDASVAGFADDSYAIHAADWDQTAGTFTAQDGTVVVDSASAQTINTEDSLHNFQVEDTTENGLIGYWKFDEGQGVSAADSSSNSNTGTLTNGPTWRDQSTEGLVGYWKFDTGSGTSAIDSSTNSNTGTLTNMEDGDWNTDTGTTDFTNPYSLDFDGSDEYVTRAGLSLEEQSAGSVSAWFKTSAGQTNKYIVSMPEASGGTNGFDLNLITSTKIESALKTSVDSSNIQATVTYSDGNWHHYAATYDGATHRLYFDGAESNSAARTGTIQNADNEFNIGRFGSFGGLYTGLVDDVRLYNRTLHPNEVKQLASGRPIDEITTTTFHNPHSLNFDGTDDYVDLGDVLDSSSTMTVSGWAKFDATNCNGIVGKRITSTEYSQYSLNTSTDSKLYWLQSSDGSSWGTLVASTSTISTGIWQHFTATNDGSNARLYIDGAETGTADSSPATVFAASTDSLRTGAARCNGTDGLMDGSIDDVRIYDYALTSSEITNLANGKYADGDDGTATYTLNTALDVDNDLYIQSGILDVSGTSYAITLANDWNNYAGASGFTDQSGTVTLDGVDQAVRGTTTFYNFTKQETTDDTTDKNLTFGVGNDTSLIGYWKFDEGTGTAATDSSANSNSGTLTNMEAGDWDSSIKASLNFQNDYSLEFDADDDEVDIGDIAAYDDPFSSGGTVSAWINADGYGESDNGNIIGNANFDGAPYGGWVFYTRSTNSGLSFYQTRGTTGGQWTCAVGLDAWHHVVITYDSSSTANDPQCYVDGLAVATTEVSAPDGAVNAVGQNFRIGNRHDGARTFDGHIDDVRIYNRALSQAEITELAAGNGVPAIYEYDVANTLDIDGLDTNDRLNVISSTTNVPFLLDVTAADACTNWLDVTDSLAGTYDIYADNTTDSGGNDEDWSTPFWVFSSCPAATRNRLMIINTAD